MPSRPKLTTATIARIRAAWLANNAANGKQIAEMCGTTNASANKYKPLSLRVRKGNLTTK
jgi:hypothetical protein